jgi:predicted enzyme related to lactoylglutathione lyase
MDEPITLDAVTIDCVDPIVLAEFWGAVLGTEIESTAGEEPHYVDLKAVSGVPRLRFQRVPEPKPTKNRVHVDLVANDIASAVARIEALGGRKTGSGAEYGFEWTVLADPEGNEFCVSGSDGMEGE